MSCNNCNNICSYRKSENRIKSNDNCNNNNCSNNSSTRKTYFKEMAVWIVVSSILGSSHFLATVLADPFFSPSTSSVSSSSSSSSLGLRNRALLVGDSLHLRCASSNNRVCGALQWLRRNSTDGNEEVITYGRVLVADFDGRYTMNDNGMPCDIQISDVKPSDAGEFACVSSDHGRQSAFLAVLESSLQCGHNVTGAAREVMEGEDVSISCSLSRFKTLSRLTLSWLPSSGSGTHEAFLPEDVVWEGESGNGGGVTSTFTVRARSPAVPSYVCRGTFEAMQARPGHAQNTPEVTCATDTLNVVFPVRDVRLQMNGTRLMDGSRVTCVAEGQPAPTYRWVIEPTGEIVLGSQTIVVHRSFIYQCIATNQIRGHAYSEASWEIYVRETAPLQEPYSPSEASTISTQATSTAQSTNQSDLALRDHITTTYDVMQLFIDTSEPPNREEPEPEAFHERRKINITSIVLGILLLLSIIIILVLFVRLSRLRRRLNSRRSSTPSSPTGGTPCKGAAGGATPGSSSAVLKQLIKPTERSENGTNCVTVTDNPWEHTPMVPNGLNGQTHANGSQLKDPKPNVPMPNGQQSKVMEANESRPNSALPNGRKQGKPVVSSSSPSSSSSSHDVMSGCHKNERASSVTSSSDSDVRLLSVKPI